MQRKSNSPDVLRVPSRIRKVFFATLRVTSRIKEVVPRNPPQRQRNLKRNILLTARYRIPGRPAFHSRALPTGLTPSARKRFILRPRVQKPHSLRRYFK